MMMGFIFKMKKICALLAGLMLWASATAATCPSGRYVYDAKIVSVYDGDTVTADVDLGFNTWRHAEKFRLYGIDAPEMRGEDKAQGTISRDWLRSAVIGKIMYIESIRDTRGKYGRYLARLHVRVGDGCLSVNDELVRLGLAVYRDY